jgi:ABC-2 type transport system permease protein
MDALRPYGAMFAANFQQMLQYRAAAVAGFATQCWWGALKIMILAAFYAGHAGSAPMPLAHAIDYTWLGQALLVLLPWAGDREVAAAVRTGAVGYERLRPADTYALWFARAASGMAARVLPRAALMLLLAAGILPLVGLGRWGLHPPPSVGAGLLFAASLGAVLLLSAAIQNLLTNLIVSSLTDRGANNLASPIVNVLSGSIVPLAFFPDWMVPALRLQPFAGLVDTPFRIYLGELTGTAALAGIGLQLAWAIVLATLGRAWLESAMRRLQMQGG